MRPRSSEVVPHRLMWERANMAYHCGGVTQPMGCWYWVSTMAGGGRPVPPIRCSDRALMERHTTMWRAWPNAAALAAWLRRSLPRYKVPDRFLAWPDTDRDTLKIDRDRFRLLALGARAGTRPGGDDE